MGGMHPGRFFGENCHPLQKQKLNRRKMVLLQLKGALRGVYPGSSLLLNPQGVPSLHPARNATIFNFVFPVIWVFLSRCSSSPLPLMGKRKRSLGFISPATRAINKRGERGAPRLYMGEKKGLNFFPLVLKGGNTRTMLYSG